jgi:hypothetical protein
MTRQPDRHEDVDADRRVERADTEGGLPLRWRVHLVFASGKSVDEQPADGAAADLGSVGVSPRVRALRAEGANPEMLVAASKRGPPLTTRGHDAGLEDMAAAGRRRGLT